MLRTADEIYYVPEGTPLNVQLVKLQYNKETVDIIVNEYGDIQGLVTVEDILEEIVGDFTTSMSPSLAAEVIPQSYGSVIIEGGADIRKLNKAFNWSLPEEEVRTINGMLLEVRDDIPLPNTHTHIGRYQIDILDVQDNMIEQVRVTLIKPLKQGVYGN